MVILHQQAVEDVGDNDAWDKFIRALHERIAMAVEHIWVAVAMRGRNHALGETGEAFGFEVPPTP